MKIGIKFKLKSEFITYDKICEEMFGNGHWYISDSGTFYEPHPAVGLENAATNEKQLKKILAINKLMNVAKYLNKGWVPNWNNNHEMKYYICIDEEDNIYMNECIYENKTFCYFKTAALAREAINIIGEEDIILAFSTDW